MGKGVSESLTQESGFATVGGVALGARVRTRSRTGYATAGGIAAGVRVRLRIRAGYASVDLVGTGADVDVAAETGMASVGAAGFGVAVKAGGGIVYTKTGVGMLGTVGPGFGDVPFGDEPFGGTYIPGAQGFGVSDSIFQETGYARWRRPWCLAA